MISQRLAHLEENLQDDPIIQRLGLDPETLNSHFARFKQLFQASAPGSKKRSNVTHQMLQRLERMASFKDQATLSLELKYSFYGNVLSSQLDQNDQQHQEKLLNLNYPGEWFPRTRGFQREFHVHVGPTNSGKTYHALKRLEEAESGVYAGPLRLLAHEVYMRLNARGKRCDLITGDDRKIESENLNLDKPMISCTVEMLPVTESFDVAVIDEIQMLGSEDRGWAWTQAVLGVMAKEVHVCGEERAVPIIKELAAACGDRVIVHRYERLSPLEMMPESLNGDLGSLQKGDCIVGFSVVVLHSLRQLIEKKLQRKCAIIYGSLPPETRAQQAKLFNEPDNDYDFLVASNAVGMGLNLNIKRLIFQTAHRNIKGRLEAISVPEIKQIAGRAGRYSTASDDMKSSQGLMKATPDVAESERTTHALLGLRSSETEDHSLLRSESADSTSQSCSIPSVTSEAEGIVIDLSSSFDSRSGYDPPATALKPNSLGLVTTLEKLDYPVIASGMDTRPQSIASAGILPPDYIIERFARYFPANTPFSYLLLRLGDMASTSRRFHLCDLKGQISIADAIEEVPNLTIADRLTFCAAPLEVRKEGEASLARAYATLVGECRGASVLDFDELDLELLEEDYTPDRGYLRKLEFLHKGIITFLWLSYRFTNAFLDQRLASYVKEMVEKRIEETLGKLSFDYNKLRKSRDQALLDLLQDKEDSQEPVNGDVASNDSSSGPSDDDRDAINEMSNSDEEGNKQVLNIVHSEGRKPFEHGSNAERDTGRRVKSTPILDGETGQQTAHEIMT